MQTKTSAAINAKILIVTDMITFTSCFLFAWAVECALQVNSRRKHVPLFISERYSWNGHLYIKKQQRTGTRNKTISVEIQV